eukprot:sb/3478212/
MLMHVNVQVAHIAGYDDEHQIERAPILEIDPIPEDRPRTESLQRLQVGKFPRENSLGERSQERASNGVVSAKQGASLDDVCVTKNSRGLMRRGRRRWLQLLR